MARRKRRPKSTPKTEAPAPESTGATPTKDDEVVTLQGRLTADPVLKTTQTGKPLTTFWIEVEHQEGEPTVQQVAAWGRTAEAVCRYKRAGDLVEVEGRYQEIAYKPLGGTFRTVTEITASRVQFLPPRQRHHRQAPRS